MPFLRSFTTRFARLRNRAVLSPITLTILTVLYLFATANRTFWSTGAEIFAGHVLSFAGFVLAVFMLTLAFFSLFGLPWIVKPFLAFVNVLSAATSYYVDTLGVIVDRDMIQNVMVTTITESKHLITAGFVGHMLLFGVLPAAVILLVRIRPQRALRTLATPAVSFVVSLALAAGLLAADMKSYAAVLRERKDLMSSYQPGAPIVGAIRYAEMLSRAQNVTVQPIGEDATRGRAYHPGEKPLLAVIVAGETARAGNFSLNGYDKDTNPRLSALPVVNFSNVSSCGTATAVSLPCMFSKFGRGAYSYEKGVSTENLLDVLTHAGLHVEWWDNNTGDKGIAKRVALKSFAGTENARYCGSGECIDGIFLDALRDYADTITEDTVLVLHQIGSHGPAYYLRYPEASEKFTPTCRTAEFKNCTHEEITNTYDNTIAYTDEFLAETVGVLNRQQKADAVLLYVSDHGESLGENGLYLHGAPYFMAPEDQTRVPMIMWMSDAYKTRFSIDQSCLAAQKDAALSHDNLFHSLLGMMDITTREHDAKLDIFTSCRNERREASR